MRRTLILSLSLLLLPAAIVAQDGRPDLIGPDLIIDPIRHDTSPPLRDLYRPVPEYEPGLPEYEVPNRPSIYQGVKGAEGWGPDPVWQRSEGPLQIAPPLLNIEGMGRTSGGGGTPPDTVGDVGPDHYFQSVNVSISIWLKNGTRIFGPAPNNVVWNGFGGSCEFQNAGDPIVVYDELADRWLMSQFTSPGAGSATQCIAISQTGDPTGAYHRYQFPTPGNDYPKLGVWPDAYYAGIRNFSGGFNFDAYAFEREQMLLGAAAQAVVFNMSALLPGVNNFLPADVDGPTPPPAGTPGIFLGMRNPSIVLNDLTMFDLDVDWTNPGNSALIGPTSIPVASYDGNVCNFNRSCVPQPGTNTRVDGFADAMMFRLPYRNFGTHQALLCTHTVDVGNFPDHAGIRWHELRNTGGGWSLFQEGTFSPDNNHRWMPSIAQNAAGDIMIGYSVSSGSIFPSIRYAGRRASDPLGQLTLGEGSIIAGTGSQTGSTRWGDYSAMSVDPSDQTTFWYTQEYYETTSSTGWQTRIASLVADEGTSNVTITVVPSPGNPVFVPPQGQFLEFTYDVTVENNGATTLNSQIWNTVTLPNGEEIGPVQFTPMNISVPSGGSFNQSFIFEFPPNPPPGTYVFNMKVGTFPGVELDRDTFDMIRSSDSLETGPSVAASDRH